MLGERGGAPLHFLFAWAIAHTGGGLVELRLVSALFAIASVPLIAVLVARLTDRTVALVATAIVVPSWMLLFHGIYGRMYSLFLFTATLSYLALLGAIERRDRRGWILWALAILACIATHPYGALVLASQGLYVLYARRLREALPAFVVVALLAIPFWRSDTVLASRFDVGVGGGGTKLGSPFSILKYLERVAGDFTVGWTARASSCSSSRSPGSSCSCGGTARARVLRRLRARDAVPVLRRDADRERDRLAGVAASDLRAAVLRACCSRCRSSGSRARAPGIALVAVARARAGRRATSRGACTTRARSTSASRRSAPTARDGGVDVARVDEQARATSCSGTTRCSSGHGSRTTRSRTSSCRAPTRSSRCSALYRAPKPLGRGVWVLDASDTNNFTPRLHIPLRYPRPASKFEARVFGPFLVIRSRKPTRTIREFLLQTQAVQLVGQSLYLGDSDINLLTVERALGLRGLDAGGRALAALGSASFSSVSWKHGASSKAARPAGVGAATRASGGAGARPRRPPRRRARRRT